MSIVGLSTHTVEAINLELAAGECVCLAGPSGAGKTQLLRAIADLDPHHGEVMLDGRSARNFSAHEWRRAVGLLPAESQWWMDRIGDHFSRIDEAQWRALGFSADTADWQVSRCSTGERQRLALLRLLANAPRVLLLDGPTASLDPVSVVRVEQLIADYRQQQQAAVLWVSHDAAQRARVAVRELSIEGGRLREAA